MQDAFNSDVIMGIPTPAAPASMTEVKEAEAAALVTKVAVA